MAEPAGKGYVGKLNVDILFKHPIFSEYYITPLRRVVNPENISKIYINNKFREPILKRKKR